MDFFNWFFDEDAPSYWNLLGFYLSMGLVHFGVIFKKNMTNLIKDIRKGFKDE